MRIIFLLWALASFSPCGYPPWPPYGCEYVCACDDLGCHWVLICR